MAWLSARVHLLLSCCTVQVADHYHFFLRGFPKQLWDTLPAELLPGSAEEEAAARPAGDLSAIESCGLVGL